MVSTSISRPPEGVLRLKVKPLAHVDDRTDEEIVQSIVNPPPVTAEENVWAFWDRGFEAMPSWQKRNVLGWARMLGPGWQIRVLDLVDESPANIFNFADKAHIPSLLGQGTFTGRDAGACASDVVRYPLVFEHGGVWLDVGIILLMHLDQICWNAIKDPKSKIEVALSSADAALKSGLAETFIMAARKGNGFIKRWMLIVLETWSGRTNNKDIHQHPLYHHLIRDGNISHVFHGASGAKLDYFEAYLAYERLRLLEDPNDGFSGPSYCKNRIMLIDYKETASAAMLTNDNGPKQYELFSTRYDQGHDSQQYQEASRYFEHLLSKAAILKLYRYREHDVPTLAQLWDKCENEDADCKPRTFGEFLRYNSMNYTQDRKIDVVKFPKVRENVLVAGLLETFQD
ncbi:putative glycosyl transferase FCK3 [Paramyrothecium foliicola]|nr:putative glycosyl transferase FCK3 [Paramyrothecium foliicola]